MTSIPNGTPLPPSYFVFISCNDMVFKYLDWYLVTMLGFWESLSLATWKPVVTPSLQVKRHQVHAEAGVLALEQMVRQLLRHDVVELLPRLGGEAHQELVQSARSEG